MKLSRIFWIILGVGLFVVAAVVLYMVYQGEVKEQQGAKDKVAAAEAVNENLSSKNEDLEAGLAQLEAELAQRQITVGELADELSLLEDELSQLEDERVQAVLQAIALLDETAAKFVSSIESIEYDEILFEFAQDSNLVVVSLTVSEPRPVVEGDITYYNTEFTVNIQGDVADILGFISTLVADYDFKTAILEPINIKVPEPLTDAEKECMKEGVREELTEEATAEATAEITTEDLVGFIIEAIAEVTGPESDWPEEIGTLTFEEIAQVIKEKIDAMVEAGFIDLLSGDLAELIEEHIANSIICKITDPMAEEIAALIVEIEEEGYNYDDLVELLGEDIAELLGEEIAGATKGDIAGLLNKYIAELVEEKMTASVAELVDEELIEELVEEKVAEEIEELEMPSATITLNIYTYEGEG